MTQSQTTSRTDDRFASLVPVFRFSIVYKGILLCVLPLLFAALLAAAIFHVQEKTKAEIANLSAARRISDEANSLLLDLYDIGNWSRREPPTRSLILQYLSQLTEKVSKLQVLVRDNPEQSMMVERARKGVTGLAVLLSQTPISGYVPLQYRVMLDGHSQDFSAARRRLMFQVASPEFLEFIARTQLSEEREHARLVESRRQLKLLLLIGTIAAASCTILATAIVTNNLRKRLHLLHENALSLERDGQFEKFLGGDDEIAYLDRALHHMQESLRERRGREEVIVNNAADVMCIINTDGVITFCSASSQKVLGYSTQALTGESFAKLIMDGDRHRVLNFFARPPGNGALSSDFVLLHANGSRLDVAVSANWVKEEDAYVCILHDITERATLRRLKDVLVNMLSEFRKPLEKIQTFIDETAAEQIIELTSEGRSLTLAAKRSLSRITALLKDLAIFESLRPNEVEERELLQVAELLESSTESVIALAKERQIAIRIADTDAAMVANRERIIRVFVNLIANAVKFSPPGSEVRISTACDQTNISISVSDDGRGIPADKLSEIFEPFNQVSLADRHHYGGTGLGLAICKAVVEEHGGSISVESLLSRGTKFTVSLPKAVTAE